MSTNLAGLMVVRGLRGELGRRPEPRMLQAIAGDTLRERQRFVLGLAYPSMFLLTIPSGLGAAAVMQLGLHSVCWTGSSSLSASSRSPSARTCWPRPGSAACGASTRLSRSSHARVGHTHLK